MHTQIHRYHLVAPTVCEVRDTHLFLMEYSRLSISFEPSLYLSVCKQHKRTSHDNIIHNSSNTSSMSVHTTTYQSVGRSVSRSVSQSVGRSVGQSFSQSGAVYFAILTNTVIKCTDSVHEHVTTIMPEITITSQNVSA